MTKGWHQNFKRAPKMERTSRDGDVFDSKTELNRWEYLRLRERIGEIRDLKKQVEFPLQEPIAGGVLIMAGKKPAVYTADFTYHEMQGPDQGYSCACWIFIVEDVKGYRDEGSKFRIRVFEGIYRKAVRIVKLVNNRWVTE